MIVAANLKTNHTRSSTKTYVDVINRFVEERAVSSTVLIFPTASSLDRFECSQNIRVGAQNAYPVESGSYTGEIGTQQLDEFGIQTVLIGHSERRALGESDALLKKKFDYFRELGYTIVYCIGESLETREQGFDAVKAFLKEQLHYFDTGYDKLIVAYEPIWAIGTGVTATLQQIDETHNYLRETIKVPLLYGGSVKIDNIHDICRIQNCDGVLVGTASWNSDNFKEMIQIGESIQ
jgi:triosephosphate isomerase